MRLFCRAKHQAPHTPNPLATSVVNATQGHANPSSARTLTQARYGLRASQSGFSLVEISVALAVLAIIGAAIYTEFSTDSTKGQRLFTDMKTIADASNIAASDMGAIPSNLTVLWTQANATAANMFDAVTATNSWHGPYVRPQQVDTSSPPNVLIKAVNDALSINISREAASAANGGNYNWIYYLRASSVPNSIIAEAMKKCTGVDIQTSTAPTFANSLCRATLGTGASASGTFDMRIADSR
jgi:prepilin-type N-terminal cleavage/methylation domain-containing protein